MSHGLHRSHFTRVVIFSFLATDMDVSPEEALSILTILRKQRRKRSRRIWIREHYLLRPELGEFFRTYKNLLDNPDEELF